ATIQDVEALCLRAPDGHLFPLSRVATLSTVTVQPEINRDNLKRMVAVTGRISGRDMGSTVRGVKAILGRPGFLPNDVYYELGGLYQQQQIAFRGLITVFVAAAVLVFVLLLFLYESFLAAVAMLATTLLAVAAVFLGLWLTDTELNITAMMGMTMVVGIATEVAIFYYSEYYDLPDDTERRERFLLAGIHRMRPIAMTTLAAILALLPLALGIGQGASMEQPLAIAIISGLVVQLPLVLIVLPSLLVIFRHHREQTGSASGNG
ncbi:MAG: efflux RND transporter permease subunit, partial [Planctomycetia bacterium]|nr:efflux RND transporter permease subunit [Planctomycetia bacterium]